MLHRSFLTIARAVVGRGTGLLHSWFRACKLGFCSESSLKGTLAPSSVKGEETS